MVYPMVQALDNPLILLEVLKTPEGKQAAAVMLTEAGVTPEKFINKVSQAGKAPGPLPEQPQGPKTPQDLANEVGQVGVQGPEGGSDMVLPIGAGSIGTSIAGGGGAAAGGAAAGGGGLAAALQNPDMLKTLLGGIQGIKPPQQNYSAAPGVSPSGGTVGGLNPLDVQKLVQLALGSQPAAAPPPSLGQIFAQGGIR